MGGQRRPPLQKNISKKYCRGDVHINLQIDIGVHLYNEKIINVGAGLVSARKKIKSYGENYV